MVVEAVEWRLPLAEDLHQRVSFDDGGQVTNVAFLTGDPMGFDFTGQPVYREFGVGLNLAAASEDDRRIVLVSGPVDIGWGCYSKSYGDSRPVLYRTGEPFSRTVKPGEDHWELEIPEEVIADMRKDLAAAKKASD